MIFILFVLALVICFYGYVFVNFQKELAGNRHRKLLGAVTIPLHVQHSRENEREQFSRESHEFYQLESPYLGPLFVVPRRKQSVNQGAKAGHARLVSAINGADAAAIRQTTVAVCSPMDSDPGNVIQISARVSARG
jgi:hypothetical protein